MAIIKLVRYMKNNNFKILAIETSCDETSASVLEVSRSKVYDLRINILSNIVSSQVKLHSKYGGVYPELASREHIKNIIHVINESLKQCNNLTIKQCKQLSNDYTAKLLKKIDYIAVTTSPGLIGSLLVGTQTAKTLAYVFKKLVVLVNHLEGHIYSNFIGENPKSEIRNPKQIPTAIYQIPNTNPQFPLIALIVSGGHTSLVYMKDHLSYKIIGETLDDAAGEAYDKVACMLNLGYPGGPVIDKYANDYIIQNSKSETRNSKQIINSNYQSPKSIPNTIYQIPYTKLFPRPLINANNFDFSFSGLKTSVLYFLKKQKKPYSKKLIQKVCYEFQEAVVETLITKTLKAAKKYRVKSIIISGGVAANSRLRELFQLKVASCQLPVKLFLPERKYCTDNATMIGAAAAYKILAGKMSDYTSIKADPNLPLK